MAKRRQIFMDEVAGEELVLPVTPSSYQWDSGIRINTVTIDSLGDLYFPGRKALATENIECFFPARAYPFNEPDTNFDPYHYVDWIEKRCQAGTVLRYIVSGTSINKAVVVESLRYYEDDGTNDLKARITIREYVAPETLAVEQAVVRSTGTAMTETVKHTVVSGDTLWSLCQCYYGTASTELCKRVAAYNGIANINVISVGQLIEFPPLDNLPSVSTAEASTASASQTAVEKTNVIETEGKKVLTIDDRAITVSISMNKATVTASSATLTYVPDGATGEKTVMISNSSLSATVKAKAGERILVTTKGGTSDYSTVNGIKVTGTIKKWPTLDTTIVVHWAASKGGGSSVNMTR